MASIASFDKEIQQTRKTVEDMRAKLAQSGVVLESLADSDKTIGDTNFDIENARIEDVLQQQKVMEANIADLIIGLEDATNVFGAEFESMKGYSGWENFVSVFSKSRAQRMRTDRVRNMSLAGNLHHHPTGRIVRLYIHGNCVCSLCAHKAHNAPSKQLEEQSRQSIDTMDAVCSHNEFKDTMNHNPLLGQSDSNQAITS